MNPKGIFSEGQRQREYSTNDMLLMSGKLIPEFDGRRSIRDMFARKPSAQISPGNGFLCAPSISPAPATNKTIVEAHNPIAAKEPIPSAINSSPSSTASSITRSINRKRLLAEAGSSKTLKRSKSASVAAASTAPGKGQQSLKGFFKPKASTDIDPVASIEETNQLPTASPDTGTSTPALQPAAEILHTSTDDLNGQQSAIIQLTPSMRPGTQTPATDLRGIEPMTIMPSPSKNSPAKSEPLFHDPIVSKESWSKLFTKPAAPRCEGHDEPCITLLTKKSGINCGRSFWMCPRPLGPSGAKERNTQWRCQTFIWCSDWNSGNS